MNIFHHSVSYFDYFTYRRIAVHWPYSSGWGLLSQRWTGIGGGDFNCASSTWKIMKALVYNGARKVRVKNVPDAKIEQATDVLVKITTTNICGSDLHMYEGRTDMEEGRVLGHENLGQVIEVGKAVRQIKVGDWVCLPFNVSCGYCKNCERGLTSACLSLNPGKVGAAYGYADMGTV